MEQGFFSGFLGGFIGSIVGLLLMAYLAWNSRGDE